MMIKQRPYHPPEISTPTPSSQRCKNRQHLRDMPETCGVTFDSNTSLKQHVTNISITAYYHLQSIGTRTYKTTCACLGDLTYWLLQQPHGWTTSRSNWATTTCSKCTYSDYMN